MSFYHLALISRAILRNFIVHLQEQNFLTFLPLFSFFLRIFFFLLQHRFQAAEIFQFYFSFVVIRFERILFIVPFGWSFVLSNKFHVNESKTVAIIFILFLVSYKIELKQFSFFFCFCAFEIFIFSLCPSLFAFVSASSIFIWSLSSQFLFEE